MGRDAIVAGCTWRATARDGPRSRVRGPTLTAANCARYRRHVARGATLPHPLDDRRAASAGTASGTGHDERGSSVIDCDVHNSWTSADVLLPYLLPAFR